MVAKLLVLFSTILTLNCVTKSGNHSKSDSDQDHENKIQKMGESPEQKEPSKEARISDFDGKIKTVDHELHILCMGNGSPTVILEAGSGGDLSTWKEVQPKIALFSRVCSYSRAGLGQSSGQHQNAENIAEDLHLLLNSKEIKIHSPSPFILIGHSFGGIYIRNYLEKYPKEVSGMVLVDATPEELPEDLGLPDEAFYAVLIARTKIDAYVELNKLRFNDISNEEINHLLNNAHKKEITVIKNISNPLIDALKAASENAENQSILESEDLKKMIDLKQKNPHPFANKPLLILIAGKNGVDDMISLLSPRREIISAVIDEKYKGSFDSFFKFDHKSLFERVGLMKRSKCSLSTRCRVVVAEKSGHNIQEDEPDVVVAAVKQVKLLLEQLDPNPEL